MLNFFIKESGRVGKASALILNTFDTLEQDVLGALSAISPRIYTVGPLHLVLNQVQDEKLQSIGSNLWKEDTGLSKNTLPTYLVITFSRGILNFLFD